MTSRNNRAARGNEPLPTWPVHDAVLAVLPVLVQAELHLRRLAGRRADALSRRLLRLFETLIEIAGDVESYSRHWSDPALGAMAAPLAAALAAYERAGDAPGERPAHVAAASLLALMESRQALIQAVERLIPAADAHATDAMALADEVADDPDVTADEKHERRRHATETDLDIGFARSTLQQAKGMR
jgi:hypothetical protein